MTMKIMKRKKKPYVDRTDIEKIQANWNKTQTLYKKKEYSGAVTRVATAAEIAANFVVREELQVKRNIESDFVDSLLVWANGIQGKIDKLILPISKNSGYHDKFRKMHAKIREINKERNLIVHGGHFGSNLKTKKIIEDTKTVIESLIRVYKPEYRIDVKTKIISPRLYIKIDEK